MKNALVFLCLALCVSVALGGWKAQCRNHARCGAGASVKISIQGPGKCSAHATSYCTVAREATKRCVDADHKYREIGCRGEKEIKSDAECFAGAAVEAFTTASLDLACKGKRTFACGFAKARAHAVACSTAKIIVDQLVFFKKQKDPVCDVQIEALIQAVAEVATQSSVGGCIGGRSFLWDADYDYAGAFEIVFAKAFSVCWTYCDKHGKDVVLDAGGSAGVVDSGVITEGDNARGRTRHPRPRPRPRPRKPHHIIEG